MKLEIMTFEMYNSKLRDKFLLKEYLLRLSVY